MKLIIPLKSTEGKLPHRVIEPTSWEIHEDYRVRDVSQPAIIFNTEEGSFPVWNFKNMLSFNDMLRSLKGTEVRLSWKHFDREVMPYESTLSKYYIKKGTILQLVPYWSHTPVFNELTEREFEDICTKGRMFISKQRALELADKFSQACSMPRAVRERGVSHRQYYTRLFLTQHW